MLLIDKTLLRLTKGLWKWIVLIAAVRLLSLAAMTRFSVYLGIGMGQLLIPDQGFDLKSSLAAAVLSALLLLVFQMVRAMLEYRCTSQARQQLRMTIFSKVMELDAGGIEKIGPVSAVTSSVDAVETMQRYYSEYLPSLLFSFIAPVYLFSAVSSYHRTAAFILLAVSFILLPLNNLFRYHIERLRKIYWSALEDMTGYFLDSIRGLTTIKLFEKDSERRSRLYEKADVLNKGINAFMKVNFTSFLATEGLIYSAMIIALVLAVKDLSGDPANTGRLLTLLLIMYSYFGSVRQLMSATHGALTAVSAAAKTEEILDTDTSRPLLKDAPYCEEIDGIRVSHVSFAYEGREQTLTDIDLYIRKGTVSAFAGMSGCGKSTAASLLMRFMDPDQGSIYMEGRDLMSMTPEELRMKICMVPQSVTVFSGTIRDNLLLAKTDASDEELNAVLRDVGLSSFCDEGLNRNTGEAGAALSGGQKQKIGIARALLSDAEYIILDEATSSVDPASEADIWACIAGLAKTRTLIIISHRLSAIRNADCIFVFENGVIKQSGSHEELMETSGLYRTLVTEQQKLEEGVI